MQQQTPRDALADDLLELVETGPTHPLEAAEGPEQLLATRRPDAGNRVVQRT